MSLEPAHPYYGCKRRLAPAIWKRFGNPRTYIEMFAGSLACLLARPGGEGPREFATDTDAGVCNYHRAVRGDPEKVAHWADYPAVHQDLTARHVWLINWIAENSHRLREDADWYDAKAAGWWLWGISLWIGGGWCTSAAMKRPMLVGKGVHVQDVRPYFPHDTSCGRGVHVRDQVPYAESNERRRHQGIVKMLCGISDRMRYVKILDRDWRALTSATALGDIKSAPNDDCAILMDPPYLLRDRKVGLYRSDSEDDPNRAALESWEWAKEHGERYKIAYCCHAGDFEIPPGWDSTETTFMGVRRENRKWRRDMVMFSPACLKPAHTVSLFEEEEDDGTQTETGSFELGIHGCVD